MKDLLEAANDERPQTASKLSTKQNLDVKDEKTEKVPAPSLPRDSVNVKPAASPRCTASPRIAASTRNTAAQRTTESKSTSKAPSTNSRPLSARKPLTKSIQPTTSIQPTVSSSPRNTKGQLNVQKQKYSKMKKELKDKQGEMFHLYDAMVKLREEMITAGVKDVEIPEQPKIVDVGPLGGGEDLSAAHKRIAHATGNKSAYLSALEEKLNSVSFWCFDLCQKAVAVNNSVLTELGHMGRDKLKVSDSEMHKTIEGLKKESHSLMQSLEKKRQSHNDTVTEVLQEMKALLQERDSLKESQKTNFEEELAQVQSERNALAEKLKAEILKGKGRQVETDTLLNNARQKIKDVESKVSSQENRIQGFHSQMRKFESQIRSRDRAHAMRLNDVSETTKMLKESKQALEKQKEALEQRVEDLKRVMNQKERKQEDTISKLNSKINELTVMLSAEQDEKRKLDKELETTISQKIAMENLKNELELQKNEIEKKLDETKSALSNAKMMSGDRAQGSKRTPHEEELWVQLQGTQVLLQSTQQTLAAVQEEKEKIEASLKNIMKKADISPQKTDEQFTEKENTINKLNERIKSISAESEQKSRTITELKRKVHEVERQLAVKYYSDRNKTHGDLKHKAAEMENEFLRLQEQNSEMEKHIRELHAELQRKENEHVKSLKDREELIRVLKNKEKKQAEQIMDLWSLVQEHESAASTVCQDMSGKDAEIKDLQKILEIKQLQILRLEKLVRKQEEQLDRWGLQRTRQEARIAELENNLREKQRACVQV
ncbi:golgin subfamily A member 6-like protein 22 [Schistocerca serialis cubense]|uniref:golgin subfamily A member 6-like protein 22 n=1 Tax=Schistocerca serialis cubense TaxID=2023355 RepID=UPI00214E285D|nr:golgin subfamily A member 6-like protein 22 [Schistocerca serialis cubense]